MTLFDQDNPDPHADPLRGAPAYLLRPENADLLAQVRPVLIRFAKPGTTTRPAPPRCEWLGCEAVGTQYDHSLERQIAGAYAEHYPGRYLCREHHQFKTQLVNWWREAAWRAGYQAAVEQLGLRPA